MRRFAITFVLATAAIGSLVAQTRPAPEALHRPGPQYAGGSHSSQFTALDQINKDNVSKLQVAWTYPGRRTSSHVQPDRGRRHDVSAGARERDRRARRRRPARRSGRIRTRAPIGARGINYWQSADGSDRRLIYLNGGDDHAINAQTGEAITSFGDNGKVDLRKALRRADVGDARAADQQPGPHLREPRSSSRCRRRAPTTSRTRPTCRPTTCAPASWRGCSTASRIRASSATTPGPTAHCETAGGVPQLERVHRRRRERHRVHAVRHRALRLLRRQPQGQQPVRATSLVAIDAQTGKRLWHFQIVHHDLWDYDLPQSPKLLTHPQERPARSRWWRRPRKQGFLFVFERKTGKPIWPIEEKPVPQIGRAGRARLADAAVPDQAGAVRAAVVHREGHQPVPAEGRAGRRCKREAARRRATKGSSRRRASQGTIEMPGHNGGANWGSSAVDPIKGEFYIVTKESPTVLKMLPGAPNGAMGGPVAGAAAGADHASGPDYNGLYRSPIDFWLTSMNLSAIGPPWSQLTAYDLNTGEIKWQVPNGTVAGLPEIPEWNGPTGAHGRAAGRS